MLDLSLAQFELVYNAFSFAIAVMGAATVFFFLSRSQVAKEYKTALTVSGVVTLVACYHYFRILNSWEGAYVITNGQLALSGVKFNDAYRYVDWLLTVPLLLIELILVMRLTQAETIAKSTKLGGLAALMIILGYPGEIAVDSGTRWLWWGAAMIPFVLIVIDLYVGLKKSVESQPAAVRGMVESARLITVLSWCFYPAVFVLPMIGLTGGSATTAVQIGYTICDIIAKAMFGVLIFNIAVRKSEVAA
ncbi:MAG: bacteriorhodopsin-like [Gemmatimonadetes bacterium]|nr:bacteriorhodopsin-like [Gemmatimonadota bacterium]